MPGITVRRAPSVVDPVMFWLLDVFFPALLTVVLSNVPVNCPGADLVSRRASMNT